MKTPTDRVILETTAKILVEDPTISNAKLLSRLVAALGAGVASRFPVNRFERLVREPAMRAMRGRQISGESPEPAIRLRDGYAPASTRGARGERAERSISPPPEAQQVPVRSPAARTPEASESRLNRRADDVDEALIEAFTLGASSRSEAEVVDAFRELGTLRNRVRRKLQRAG